ncbi:MAG: PDZ domain-containing protein [Dehalococcoidia bacterium]|nr:PDZ domain-containing protein [Dehalococcoidia bacterium]
MAAGNAAQHSERPFMMGSKPNALGHENLPSLFRFRLFTWLVVAATIFTGSGCALAAQPPRTTLPELSTTGALTAAKPGPATEQPRPGSLPNVADVAAAVRPAVAFIATGDLALDFFQQPIQQEGAGSGVIFDQRGYLITNNHVVENARNIQVSLPDGRTFTSVKVVGRDPATDLAVLKIEGANLPSVPLGNSGDLRVGDWVIAIGNALGLQGGPTVTAGVVGATGRSIREQNGVRLDELIQTDAAINPGNSGGPLINLSGQVIGINTAIDTRGQGIGFAISINSAKPILDDLVQRGRVVRPFLGVNVSDITPIVRNRLSLTATEGAIIAGVQTRAPADQAGMRVNDVVTGFNGKPVKDLKGLLQAIRQSKPGDKVELTVLRDGKQQTLNVTLGETLGVQ